MIYTVLKAKLWKNFMLFFFEALFKLGFSIILQFLFQSVASGDKKTAYILAFFGGICWLFSQINRHNAFYEAPIIGARIRTGLVYSLFAKLSSESQFIIKNSDITKVTNMLSNDFNII